MTVFMSADHGGYKLKTELKKHLEEQGITVQDFGVDTDAVRVDFPDYVVGVAREVVAGKGLGIMVCGSGGGICVAANKIDGIRAILCANPYEAMLARRDDDANVLCLGGRLIGTELAKATVDAFLAGEFAHGRYEARMKKITELEHKGLNYDS